MSLFASITDVLKGIPTGQAVSAVHLAIRLITHTTSLPSAPFYRQALEIDFTEREREIANELIDRIERNEEVSIAELDKQAVEKYINMLAAFVDELTRSERDPVRGQALLEKLRIG